jgi:hypothetical protein
MAITTLDGVLAGMQPTSHFLKVGVAMEGAGIMHSHAYSTGSPGAIATPAPGIAGAALTTLSGSLPWTNPVSGNSYLARLTANANAAGTLILVDRLWHNSGITVTTTTAQTVNSATFPARDRNGTTNGDDILIGIEVSNATGNGANITNTTMSYTNSAGTAGKTATMASFPQTANAGTFVPFQLAAGDVGVRSIQSLTLGTSYSSGTIHLVAYRVLSRVDVAVANIGNAVDALTGGFPRLYDNTVPMLLWLPSATTAVTILGEFIVTQG